MDLSNAVEKTLSIVLPQAMPFVAQIRDQLIMAGFTILKQEDMTLSQEMATQFCAKTGNAGKAQNLSSGQCCLMVLAKRNAISDLMLYVEEARGNPTLKNLPSIMHASTSISNAKWEIKFFFPQVSADGIPTDKEARDFVQDNLKPVLVQALTELCKAKPENPISQKLF
eukprot:GGOE01022197.1.p1 GENE.GGOE01022197.1~~GGOE01022197.1.p1  ORF type:complete len:169 (-),score=27.54 GGOE01022197.1:267-773(-)